MTEVFPGQVLGGKYRVDRVLGAGGMGMVVAATHLQLDERVAIKFLLPEALQNQEAVARFGREAANRPILLFEDVFKSFGADLPAPHHANIGHHRRVMEIEASLE